MLRLRLSSAVALAAVSILSLAAPARAANILFVADGASDTGVATALEAEGHTVTTVTNDLTASGVNTTFAAGGLDEYDAIFWSVSAGASYLHSDATSFANLDSFVRGGGRVMVFGYDGTLGDTMLLSFLGATGSYDQVGVAPGPIAMVDNSLTVGVVDLRGMTPSTGSYDKDCLTGLSADTTLIVASSGMTSCAQWSLRTLGDGEVAWVSNGDYSGSHTSWTTAGNPFNSVLRNFASAADAASSEPGAPEIDFDRVFGGEEGAEVVLTVTVTDPEGDDFTFSWDLDDDGTFGENAGMATYTIAAGTSDGEQSLRVSVQASDGAHTSSRTRTLRIRNVAPRITSDPPVMTSVGEMIRYAIVTEDPAGALDPMTYALIRGPMGAAINDEGVFVWTPTDLDVTTGEERIGVEIAVDDGDGGTASQSWEMTVSPNRTPGAPALLYPANGVAILDTQPRLVAQNATDADVEDTLTYFFELDDEDTFETPIASGEMLPQGTGFTAYELTAPLATGRYHWRAWAFDGAARSEAMTTSFWVVPDPDADAGIVPVDGGVITVPDAGGGTPTDRGCGCSTPGTRAGSGGATLLLVALAALVRRRARRAA